MNQDNESSSSSTVYRRNASISTTVDHPRLIKVDPENIRVFLQAYDAYCNEVRARAEQLIMGGSPSTTEISRPVGLKYCVDAEYLHAAIALGRINGAHTYESLTNEILRKHLDSKCTESRNIVTLAMLDEIVLNNLRMNMNDTAATSRVESLFILYIMLLRKHGLSWVQDSNPKVAVYHVLSAIKPKTLCNRLENDLEFGKTELRKDFKGFLTHAMKVAEAFELINDEGKRVKMKPQLQKKGSSSSSKSTDNNSNSSEKSKAIKDKPKRLAPPCPYHTCKSKNLRHWIDDCKNSNEAEKKQMKDEISRMKSTGEPSESTRSKSGTASQKTGEASKSGSSGTTRRVDISASQSASVHDADMVTLCDERTEINAKGRCDDGADDSIVSRSLAEKSVLKGIGSIQPIPPIEMKMPIKDDNGESISFTTNRIWKVPRTILRVASGKPALQNISYLIVDGELDPEDVLIGRPVLQHLGVDTATLLDLNREKLHDPDCDNVGNPSIYGNQIRINRITVSSKTKEGNDHTATAADPENIYTSISTGEQVTAESDSFAEMPQNVNQQSPESFSNGRPSKNYFKIRSEPDPFPDESLLDPVDNSQDDDVKNALDKALSSTTVKEMSSEQLEELSDIIMSNKDVFRLRMCGGAPAKIPPLQVQLTSDAKPVRIKLRNYSPEQKEFLKSFVDDLVSNNMAYPNPTSQWAAAPLLVSKSGPIPSRFTVDLRPVNKYTARHQYPMPNLEQELSRLSGSKFFANFDFSQAYWQLPLHEDSQQLQSFITPDGVYSPTRVLHGTTNAVTHLQSSITTILTPSLRKQTLLWLDDLLLFAPSVDKLFQLINDLLQLCRDYNLYLHPEKCQFCTTTVRWCGRIITPQGVTFDPKDYQGIYNLQMPTTVAQLQQLICAFQWIRTTIPEFSKVIEPIRKFLNRTMSKTGSRSKRSTSRISLTSTGWGKEEAECFAHCKNALASQVTLSHRDPSKRLCLFTDASDTCWSGFISQIPTNQIGLPPVDQDHEPLAFLSGHFNSTELGWSTYEKEAYAIMASTKRMHWILASADGFDLYTDHNNLVFTFDPLAVAPDLSISSVKKVLRWAVRLSIYNYVCFHIKGSDNVWADLISRWMPKATLRRLIFIPPLLSSQDANFKWPKHSEITSAQNEYISTKPENVKLIGDAYRDQKQRLWLPDDANDLQLRVCIIAHTGPSGHRGYNTTVHNIEKEFIWSTVREDVDKFLKACIHCISTKGGRREPRPFGPALHGMFSNDLIQFDFIEMGPSSTGMKYLLMIKDDFSSYSWFIPFSNANAENAADGLLEWCATFSIPKYLMTDGGSHFKNETIRFLTKALQAPHHFTLPYTPWSNGSVERLGREILRLFRATVSEMQKPFTEWPALVPVLEMSLNNSPSPQCATQPPTTIFIGHKPSVALSIYKQPSTATLSTLPDSITERFRNLTAIKNCIDDINPLIQKSISNNRQVARANN